MILGCGHSIGVTIRALFKAGKIDADTLIITDSKEFLTYEHESYKELMFEMKESYDGSDLLELLDELRDPYGFNDDASFLFVKLRGDIPCILNASGGGRIRDSPTLEHS